MRFVLLSLLLLLPGCPGPHPAVLPTDSDKCAMAEAQLLKLQCRDSRGELLGGPNKHGVDFTSRCKAIQAQGVPLNPTCISTSTSCQEVDRCLELL